MRGVFNVVLGIVMVIGGLSGKLVLIGTHSGLALAAIGVILIVVGGFRMLSGGRER
ncbi:MAG: hypothetical protein R3F59_07160 [Myxococcota bacterium]